MKFGIYVPMYGPFGDARVLADLAKLVEASGWDGFFIWDQITGFAETDEVTDAQVALTAIALSTSRIRFGALVTPLARRRPQKYAREAMAIDRLSGGRLICGVGLGNSPEEFEDLGEPAGLKRRAEMLDEALLVVTGLWSGQPFSFHGKHYTLRNAAFQPTPLQVPRIPIWVAGSWPKTTAPFRRAARWDGVFPLWSEQALDGLMPVAEYERLLALIRDERGSDAPFDAVQAGTTPSDPAKAGDIVRPYGEIGVTWWLENLSPWSYNVPDGGEWPVDAMRARIQAGPPAP